MVFPSALPPLNKCQNMLKYAKCLPKTVSRSFTCEHREPIDAREPAAAAAALQPLHRERCENTPNHILPEKLVIWACCVRRKCNILNISVDVSIQRIFSTRTSTDVVFFLVEGRIKVVSVKSSQPSLLDCPLAVAAWQPTAQREGRVVLVIGGLPRDGWWPGGFQSTQRLCVPCWCDRWVK